MFDPSMWKSEDYLNHIYLDKTKPCPLTTIKTLKDADDQEKDEKKTIFPL